MAIKPDRVLTHGRFFSMQTLKLSPIFSLFINEMFLKPQRLSGIMIFVTQLFYVK